MKIEFKPKYLILPERVSSSNSENKETLEKPNSLSIANLRSEFLKIFNGGIKKVAKFGGVKMSEGETESKGDDFGLVTRNIETVELEVQKNYNEYVDKLRQTPESKEIEKFRKSLIAQFSNPNSKN